MKEKYILTNSTEEKGREQGSACFLKKDGSADYVVDRGEKKEQDKLIEPAGEGKKTHHKV